jgi:hypothetical protein
MNDPYVYITPNELAVPKYKAIRAAYDRSCTILAQVEHHKEHGTKSNLGDYNLIGNGCRTFHEAILLHAPPSADRTAAERCCRLARILAKEAVNAHDRVEAKRFMVLAYDELLKAKMQACAAIALG